MLTVLTFLATMLTLTSVSVSRSLTETRTAERFVAKQQALYLAEAGADEVIQWIRNLPQPPICAQNNYPCTVNPNNNPEARHMGVGSYTASVFLPASNHDSWIHNYVTTVAATTDALPTTRTLTYQIRMESFARFAYFTNAETTEEGYIGYWVTGNAFHGPFHTNGQMNLWGTPIFEGPVSTVAATVSCPWGCTPNFQQGITQPVAPIPMPEPSLEELKNHANLVLTGTTTVALAGNNLLVTNGGVTTSYNVGSTHAVYVQGDLNIAGGELNGQLTLGSSHDILVAGQVHYQCNPEDLTNDPDCVNAQTGQIEHNDDVLGLVAKHDVRIATSAPSNLTIQATVMAVQGAFKVDNYWCPPKGILHVYGGIIARYGGFTGITDGQTIFACYAEQHGFDQRLLNISPPYYPTTGRYEGVYWAEQ